MTSIKKNDILNALEYCDKNRLFDKLNDVYRELPSGDCNGCGKCCMESVGINLVEFLNIYNHLQNNNDLRKESLNKILDYYFLEYTKKSACPFKDENNRCMIYEVRPLNCRLFGHWEKIDYNKNLQNVTSRNIEYRDLIKDKYGFDISEEVVNYKINYCEDFKPNERYLSKSERLEFSDNIMILDSKILSNEVIDIEFKDRGIVEYFIESLFDDMVAYNIKINVSKEEEKRRVALKRLKQLLVR